MSSSTATETILPAKNLTGSLRLPGDKSISHRYAMLAGLAEGTTLLTNFSTGADCASSLGVVEALGAKIVRRTLSSGEPAIEVTGTAGAFRQPTGPLDCGNSGSTMRMMSGLLAPHPHTFTLIGDESLSRRPMERIRKPLTAMGARISLTEGHAPVVIQGGALTAITFDTPIPSAQVKTAVLFAGLQANGTTTLSESIRTRDHGEHALRAFGAVLTRTQDAISIDGGQKLHAIEAAVPGDISSAAFFLCAALLFPGSNLVLDGLGMNPTRAALLDVLTGFGGKFNVLNLEENHGEIVGTVSVQAPKNGLVGADISGATAAQLIDELPVLAAIAPYSQNGIKIRDAKELRVKESDRIALVAENLRAMGATVTEHEDGLDVPGNQKLHGAAINSGGDHRIAMAFSVAALRAEGPSIIHGSDAASISLPEFYALLNQIAER
jgi:3-phosphoshikimate 1-carboxyvinyltransferase